MNVGDIVTLKSGGPCMTVIDISKAQPSRLEVTFEDTIFIGVVSCRWFNKTDELQEAVFRMDVLTAESS